MSKYFVVNQEIDHLSKEEAEKVEKQKEQSLYEGELIREKKNNDLINETDNLRYVDGRVIVKINTQLKNSHTFSHGLKIRRERQFNEFNRRITQPTNAVVISSEYVPRGAEILISHNAIHDSNRIFHYKNFREMETDIRYYSIPEYECFAWREAAGEFMPMKHFDFALKVFKEYEGSIHLTEPFEIKDVLFVTTGQLKGNVVQTLKGCDYIIVYQESNGVEGNLVRFRPFGNPIEKREEEAVAILNNYTDKVYSGELLVGISKSDCKKYVP